MPSIPVNGVRTLDLHVELPRRRGKAPALRQALRDAVTDGRLPAGAPLPPYRTLAADLGLSRSVVAAAYADLVEEGWFTARQGRGTQVAALPAPKARAGADPGTVRASARRQESAPAVDLTQGIPSPDLFPRQAWARATRHVMSTADASLFGPTDPRGVYELRAAVAAYLQRTRGVMAGPDDVVITAGYADALDLIARATALRPHLIEDMGLPFHDAILRRHLTPTGLLATDENGAVPPTGELKAHCVCHVTPAHQFPLGPTLSPERRRHFVTAVQHSGGLIVEDDYDGEFRYDRHPVGALQPLAPQHVAYVGSASKALSPSLRVAWVVAPPWLRDALVGLKGTREQHTSAIMQSTLARLFTDGSYDHTVRTARTRYRRRRNDLTELLSAESGWTPMGLDAGLHLTFTGPPSQVAALGKRFECHGIAVDSLQTFNRSPTTRSGFVVGYSRPAEAQWPGTLARLRTCLAPASAGSS